MRRVRVKVERLMRQSYILPLLTVRGENSLTHVVSPLIIMEDNNLHQMVDNDLHVLSPLGKCETHAPSPVCACGTYRLQWP